jgi:hypothetical protein
MPFNVSLNPYNQTHLKPTQVCALQWVGILP